MKKRILTVLSLAMALVVALFVVGCGGPDPEEVIREDVTSRLDLLKDTDSDEYKELVDMMDSSLAGADQYGIEADEVVASLFDGYDYEITEVEVDEDTATVEVAVTCKSLGDIEDAMYDGIDQLYEEAAANPEKFATMSEDEINEYAGQFIMDIFNETEARETDLTLTYTETDGEWEADEDPFNMVATCVY